MKQFDVGAAPHVPAARSVRQIMLWVIVALLPGIIGQAWLFGIGVLLQILIACAFAWLLEALMLRLRQQPLRPFLSDFSAPLTAILFALCVPPLAPWWIALLGMIAAIVLAKHLYGGLGYNLFNPAMVGFVVVLVCFPYEISQWPAPHASAPMDAIRSVLLGQPPASGWDSLAQPTPLDALRQGGNAGLSLGEIRDGDAFGAIGGRGWEWLALLYAAGGLLLVGKRIIPWQTPLAVLGTVVLLTLPGHLLDPDLSPSPLLQLGSGALVFAAFFIATDPVSGCTTPRGRWIFGAGVAALTLAIREWGNYPDGVAFAVLLMNCAAPWIDLHSRPRIYGEAPRR